MTQTLRDRRAEDGACLNEYPAPAPRFRVFELAHPVYARHVIDPSGAFKEVLSFGLSDMVRGRAHGTGRDYIGALLRTLDIWAGAQPELVDDLFTDTDNARKAIMAMLHANGCKLERSRSPDGSWIVKLLDEEGAPAEGGQQRITLALLALKHCFTALETCGRWSDQNPLLVDQHARFAHLMATLPATSRGHPHTYAGSLFVVAGRPSHYRSGDCTHYAPQICAAAEEWPAGVAAATRLMVAAGCRISEVWALSLSDWAAHDFQCCVASPDKGSAGKRSKTLFISEPDRAALAAWVDGPRATMTGLTLAKARRCARRAGAQSLAGHVLFLGPRGRPITAASYRDHYFRPTMQRLGLSDVVTPHRTRHEKAFRALTLFHETATSPQEEARLIADFADLMGWRSGAEMVHYYAPQRKLLTGQSLAELLFADADEPICARPAREPQMAPAEDPLLTAFREGVFP